MMVLRVVVAAAVGFYLPGYLVARGLRARAAGWLAFPLSLLVLFYCVFGVGMVGGRVTFGNVLAVLVVVNLGMGAWAWKRLKNNRSAEADPTAGADLGDGDRRSAVWWVMVGMAGVMGWVALQRAALAPLSGFDTAFRWEALAERVFELGRFDFYPPRTAGHFRDYFYVDSFPPLVAFAYWWIYAAAGERLPALTAVVVAPQYWCGMGIAYAFALRVGRSRMAGALAVGALAAAGLYFRALVIGQETGLTALSLVAALYVVVTSERRDWRDAALAGALAALGGMCREYGLAFVALAAAAAGWRWKSWRGAVVVAAVGALVAGPWYVRNFVLTGNPFYALRFLGLPMNEAHAGMMDTYKPYFGVGAWDAAKWGHMVAYVFGQAQVQMTLGLAAAVWLVRRVPELLAGAMLVTALWLWSVGYTNGGAEYSTRVLAPAAAVLSVAAGVGAAGLFRQKVLGRMVVLGIVAAGAFALVNGWIFPFSTRHRPPEGVAWLDVGLARQERTDAIEPVARQLFEVVPQGHRILGDNLAAHQAFRRAGYELVPPWSPEVSFVTDRSVPAKEAERRLKAMGITMVLVDINAPNTSLWLRYLPLWEDPQGWVPVARSIEGGGELGAVLFRLP